MDPPDSKGSFVAPIHRLPTELLRSILLLVYNSSITDKWSLSWIDSRTRSIVISTPLFWTSVWVVYVHELGQDFNFVVYRLRLNLQRAGLILPLDVDWTTSATERQVSRLLCVFAEENTPFNRWRSLNITAGGVFPANMMRQRRLGEFTNLKTLHLSGPHSHFFFHHLEKTKNLARLRELVVDPDSSSYEELSTTLPRVMSQIQKLTMLTRSTFSSGLKPNTRLLFCDELHDHASFPKLEVLVAGVCSIRPNPANMPHLSHLEVYFAITHSDASILEFPALVTLALECGQMDLRPLTWLSAPNLTSLRLQVVAKKFKYFNSALHSDAPSNTRLKFLNYPRVSNLSIHMPLKLDELGNLLPHFLGIQEIVIPFDVYSTDELAIGLLSLLAERKPKSKKDPGRARFMHLKKIRLLSSISDPAVQWEPACRAVLNFLVDGVLREIRMDVVNWKAMP